MAHGMDLLNPAIEPTDEQLERLMRSVSKDVRARARKARKEQEEILKAAVAEACSRHRYASAIIVNPPPSP